MTDDGRFPVGALVGRVTMLAVVIAGTSVLVASLVLPPALAVTTVVDSVETNVLDVGPLPDEETLVQNSFIYAADGRRIAEINFRQSRRIVNLEDIPEVTRNAVLATEDANFYEHNGVNYGAMTRALIENVQAGEIEQGGSTITQQYVDQAYMGGNATTYERKITEAMWALEVERRLTKDEILERYLNTVYLGSGVYGFATAADRYFSKHVRDLSLSESATLAGMIRLPEGNNPLTSSEAAQQRRDIVLDQMTTNGFITAAQGQQAKDIPVAELLNPRPPPVPEEAYWTRWITELLTDEQVAQALGTQVAALDAMGLTEEERIQRVFQRGLHIHTTLDRYLQHRAQESIHQYLTYDDEPPEDIAQEPHGAIVSVAPGTGAILAAAVGPRTFGTCDPEEGSDWVGVDDAGRLLCDKTVVFPAVPGMGGSGRQPGSSFKPLVTTAALESGLPAGWQIDATGPQMIPNCDNGEDWEVNNSGGDGLRDMYSGIAGSSNVFHARLIREIGPDKVVEVANRFGIENLPAECSLALGAAEVYPLEMASAFAAFANRGVYCQPYAIARIVDADGNVIYEHEPQCERVIDEAIADRVVDIMAGPVEPGGTAPGANLDPFPTRGKTGTTQSFVDAWFVGYIRQMATAAWIGYPNGTTQFETLEQAQAVCGPDVEIPACLETRYLENVTIGGNHYSRVFGATLPAPMWEDYMHEAVKRLEPEGFPDPGPLPTIRVPNFLAASSLAEAEEIAEEAGVNLVVEEITDYRPEGTFVSQRPGAGSEIIAGRAVILEVSNGEGEPPRVPSVVGLSPEEAAQVLSDAGYSVSASTRPVDNQDRHGVVVAQSPGGGARLLPGGDVAIVVGRFVEPEPSPPAPSPDDGGGGGGNGNGAGAGGGGPGGPGGGTPGGDDD